jgi:hypothetical protein
MNEACGDQLLFCSDRVLQKLLDVCFISTDDQVTDGFMKAISQGRLLEFQCNLNLIKIKEVEIER